MVGKLISQNLQKIQAVIKDSAAKSGRHPSDILLLAVSKYQPEEKIKEAYSLGVKSFGENYVQEALLKKENLKDLNIDWHFIGRLQSKKISKIVHSNFSLVHSLDRLELVKKISMNAFAYNMVQKVLIQVNTANEQTKAGVLIPDVPDFLNQLQKHTNIQLCGFMAMPPLYSDKDRIRIEFEKLRICRDEWEKYVNPPHSLSELSMGTSHDYDLAIQEGATIIRLGTQLLGARDA